MKIVDNLRDHMKLDLLRKIQDDPSLAVSDIVMLIDAYASDERFCAAGLQRLVTMSSMTRKKDADILDTISASHCW